MPLEHPSVSHPFWAQAKVWGHPSHVSTSQPVAATWADMTPSDVPNSKNRPLGATHRSQTKGACILLWRQGPRCHVLDRHRGLFLPALALTRPQITSNDKVARAAQLRPPRRDGVDGTLLHRGGMGPMFGIGLKGPPPRKQGGRTTFAKRFPTMVPPDGCPEGATTGPSKTVCETRGMHDGRPWGNKHTSLSSRSPGG